MIKNLMNFITGREDAEDASASEAEARVAVAAVLVEAARRDGVYDPREQATIDAMLADAYGLDAAAAQKLRAEGEAAQAAAVDVHRFTRVIKDSVPHEERGVLLERIWRVILSDDRRDDAENGFMRKLTGLLYVEDRENARARQRAMAARNG